MLLIRVNVTVNPNSWSFDLTSLRGSTEMLDGVALKVGSPDCGPSPRSLM